MQIRNYVLLAHTLERLSFFSVGAIAPLILWGDGSITTSQLAIFYMVFFTSYRVSPAILAYCIDFFSIKNIFLIGGICEIVGFSLILYTKDFSLILMFCLISGFGGGLFSNSISKLIELNSAKGQSNIFFSHFMLINLSSFMSPLLALLNYTYRLSMSYFILMILFILIIKIFYKIGDIKDNLTDKNKNYFKYLKSLFNIEFINIWILSIFVWASSSFIYAIIPTNTIIFENAKDINVWLMIDSFVAIMLYFILKKIKIFDENDYFFLILGLTTIGVSLIAIATSSILYITILSVILLSIGGTISFVKIYTISSKISVKTKKSGYYGLLSLSGAIGEGSSMGLFSLFPNSNNIIVLIAGITIIIVCLIYFNIYKYFTYKS